MIAGSVVFFIKLSENRLKVILAFSAAYLLALSFLHLLPEIFEGSNGKTAGLWILAGFFIQVILEFFSSGIEHGHAHIHGHKHRIPFALFAGLYLHSFIEGLPLAGIFDKEKSEELFSFIAGISLHNIPIAIAFAGLMIHEQISRGKVILYLLLLAMMAPLGAFTGNQLQGSIEIEGGLTRVFTAMVVGIFLHIATTIIFESSEKNHRYHISKLLAIIGGALLAWLLIS